MIEQEATEKTEYVGLALSGRLDHFLCFLGFLLFQDDNLEEAVVEAWDVMGIRAEVEVEVEVEVWVWVWVLFVLPVEVLRKMNEQEATEKTEYVGLALSGRLDHFLCFLGFLLFQDDDLEEAVVEAWDVICSE